MCIRDSHARRRRCVSRNDVIAALAGVAQGFRLVVVKRQVCRRYVGKIGGDVTAADVDLAILHVLRVDKLDVVNQV